MSAEASTPVTRPNGPTRSSNSPRPRPPPKPKSAARCSGSIAARSMAARITPPFPRFIIRATALPMMPLGRASCPAAPLVNCSRMPMTSPGTDDVGQCPPCPGPGEPVATSRHGIVPAQAEPAGWCRQIATRCRFGPIPGGGDNDRVHPTTPPDRWTIVVPLKGSARGKSRIDVDPALRRRLAVAMALDTVAAASNTALVARVLVVVEDRVDGVRLSELPGVQTLLTRRSGLNEAVEEGLRSLVVDGPVAAL